MRLLDRINRTGTTVVMATHDHAIVDAMRRRVIQLERGRIVRDENRGVYEGARNRQGTPEAESASLDETPSPNGEAAVDDAATDVPTAEGA
jgi:energy-coupling factor transporter ATP-binding protein EcfA2